MEWNLPAKPMAPPTADTDGVYVNCQDGNTYGIRTKSPSKHDIDWNVDAGWTDAGLAVKTNLYGVDGTHLHAVDPESGKRQWKYEIGDWRHTAPVLGRDTLFVGGDKLHALDPTPGPSTLGDDGPAVRFTKSFAGRVGPGPVLNDGILYVVAQTGKKTYHLLALE